MGEANGWWWSKSVKEGKGRGRLARLVLLLHELSLKFQG